MIEGAGFAEIGSRLVVLVVWTVVVFAGAVKLFKFRPFARNSSHREKEMSFLNWSTACR